MNNSVPDHYLKEKCESFCESLKVMHVVEAGSNFDRLEQGHSEHGKDEHDEKEEEGNVDQGWEGHHQRKEQGSNPFCPLDQTKDPTNFGHSHLENNFVVKCEVFRIIQI